MNDSGVYVYYYFYGALMRLAHRHNWHHMKPCYPDGDTMLWCHWCGIRIVTKRRERSDVSRPTASTTGRSEDASIQYVGIERPPSSSNSFNSNSLPRQETT